MNSSNTTKRGTLTDMAEYLRHEMDAQDAARYRWLVNQLRFERGSYRTDEQNAIIETSWFMKTEAIFTGDIEREPASVSVAIDSAMAIEEELARITPSHEQLQEMARNSPPPAEWLNGDEEKPW